MAFTHGFQAPSLSPLSSGQDFMDSTLTLGFSGISKIFLIFLNFHEFLDFLFSRSWLDPLGPSLVRSGSPSEPIKK
jgi:hypothetical protein